MNEKIIEKLTDMGACNAGMEYARSHRTMQEAWDKCGRGDWMLWLLGRLAGPPASKSRKELVLAACACARLSLDHIPAGEKRPLAAIEMAEAWARGQDGASLDDVRRAAEATTAYASAHAATAYAAAAAAASAYAAAASGYAATASGYAAAAYDYAAYDYDYAAYASGYARKKTLLRCAEIVRSMYPKAPRMKGEEE